MLTKIKLGYPTFEASPVYTQDCLRRASSHPIGVDIVGHTHVDQRDERTADVIPLHGVATNFSTQCELVRCLDAFGMCNDAQLVPQRDRCP